MPVVAKLGVLHDRSKVRTDTGTFDVRPSETGGYIVEAPPGEEPGLVQYDPDHQILRIERPDVALTIAFQPDSDRTTFRLNGRAYEVAATEFGEILFTQEGRPVLRGHLTTSGVHLETFAPEFHPIERELAFGLALRGAYGDERFWRKE